MHTLQPRKITAQGRDAGCLCNPRGCDANRLRNPRSRDADKGARVKVDFMTGMTGMSGLTNPASLAPLLCLVAIDTVDTVAVGCETHEKSGSCASMVGI